MKSFAFVAVASTPSASTCTTKAGQIDFIKPMVQAWETYNNWFAFNENIAAEIKSVNGTAIAKLGNLETTFNENFETRNATAQTAIQALNSGAAGATADVQFASRSFQEGITRQYYREFYASGNRTERISEIIDGKLAELESELNATTLALQGQMATTTERYEGEIADTYTSSNTTFDELTLDFEASLSNSIPREMRNILES